MRTSRVAIVGAGIGGLAAAIDLARQGVEVLVFEAGASPGGKMRTLDVGGARLDAGPTVLTMRETFEAIFADAGASLADHVTLRPLALLARHAWSEDERLDLFADPQHSADAIGRFAGAEAARGFEAFRRRARDIYETLEPIFMRAPRPSPLGLVAAAGIGGLGRLSRISPFATLWSALGGYFRDGRLRQLFARYATYCGSSPFAAPATLMLIAHAEMKGVFVVEGGIHRLALAMARLATRSGAAFRYDTAVARIIVAGGRASGVHLASGECVPADFVVCNADANALATGLLGPEARSAAPPTPPAMRSLSAATFLVHGRADGFPLPRHSVFFSGDYPAEFADIFGRGRLPAEPTVYVCAQDRDERPDHPPAGAERIFCLVNAPPIGDRHVFTATEVEQCRERAFRRLEQCGLRLDPSAAPMRSVTPNDFDRLYPGTGGALYGPASHGWTASFRRPGSRTRLPGLYLAGGSTHPGPGMPMAATSGRLAAAALIADLGSMPRFQPTAMPGGTSMRSATTAGTA